MRHAGERKTYREIQKRSYDVRLSAGLGTAIRKEKLRISVPQAFVTDFCLNASTSCCSLSNSLSRSTPSPPPLPLRIPFGPASAAGDDSTLSLAPLAVRLLPFAPSMLERLLLSPACARALALGRCISKLLLLLPRRGGGGGGGPVLVGLVMSSAEPERRCEERRGMGLCMDEAVERRDEERLALRSTED